MLTPKEVKDAGDRLDANLAAVAGCQDSSCMVVRPKGMCTNGGCRCFNRSSPDYITIQRVLGQYRRYRKEIEDV